MSGFSRRGQMSERKQFRAIKGTRDILPPDSALWNWFEHTAREVFESYNFGEIRLPTFEETEVFARAIGIETDVVSKEMYTFEAVEASFAAIDALLRYISIQKVAPRDSTAIARLKGDLEELGIQVKRPEVAQELAKNPANQQ